MSQAQDLQREGVHLSGGLTARAKGFEFGPPRRLSTHSAMMDRAELPVHRNSTLNGGLTPFISFSISSTLPMSAISLEATIATRPACCPQDAKAGADAKLPAGRPLGSPFETGTPQATKSEILLAGVAGLVASGHVHGGRGVCLGQLAIGYRTSRSRKGEKTSTTKPSPTGIHIMIRGLIFLFPPRASSGYRRQGQQARTW
jgi:hypothetical protein